MLEPINEFDNFSVEFYLFQLELILLYAAFLVHSQVDEVDIVHEVCVDKLANTRLLQPSVLASCHLLFLSVSTDSSYDGMRGHLQRKNQLNHFLTDLVLVIRKSTIFGLDVHVGIPDLQESFNEERRLLNGEVFEKLDDLVLNLVEVLLNINCQELLAIFVLFLWCYFFIKTYHLKSFPPLKQHLLILTDGFITLDLFFNLNIIMNVV